MPIENIKDEKFRELCTAFVKGEDREDGLFQFFLTSDVAESDFIEMLDEKRMTEMFSSNGVNPANIGSVWFSKNPDCSAETFNRLKPYIEEMAPVIGLIIGSHSSQEQLIKLLENPREGLKLDTDNIAHEWLLNHSCDDESFRKIAGHIKSRANLVSAAVNQVHQIDDPRQRHQSFLALAQDLKINNPPSQIFVDEICKIFYVTDSPDRRTSPKISAQEFVDHILKSEDFGSIPVDAQKKMIMGWVAENPNHSNEDLLLIADNIRLPEADRASTIVEMAKSIGDGGARYNFFLDAVKSEIILPNAADSHKHVVDLYYDLELPTDRITKICLSLEENSEGQRLNLFRKFIEQDSNLPITDLAEGMIRTFSQDNTIKLLLGTPSVKEAAIRDSATNRLYQTWGRSRKGFLFAVAGGDEFRLRNVLTEESLTTVKAQYGEDIENIDLATLIFRRSQEEGPKPKLSFSQPIAELMEQRLPNLSTTSYCTKDEMELIQRETEALPSNIGVNNITSYLKGYITEAPSLTPEEISSYEINFTNSAALVEDRAVINDKFRKLLSLDSNKVYSEEYRKTALSFYEAAIGHKINPEELPKLARNFSSNRNKIAKLFGQDGEFDKYIGSCVGKSSDGCVANIGTKSEVALTESLVKDPYARIIYSAFANKLCFQLLNSGSYDNLGSSADGAKIFENTAITSAYLIPAGFITAVKNEFLGEKGRMRDPWNYIKEALGKNNAQILDGVFSEKSEELEEIENGPVAKLREEIKKLKAQLPQDEISEINKKILDRATTSEERKELRQRKDEIQKMRQEDPKSSENLTNNEQKTKLINEQIQQLQDKIGNIKSAIIEEEAAKIATYITLQMSLPQLLNGSKLKTEVEETFKHSSFNPPITIIPVASEELSPPKPIISNINHGPTFLSDINSTFVPSATQVPSADPIFDRLFGRPFARPTVEPTTFEPTTFEPTTFEPNIHSSIEPTTNPFFNHPFDRPTFEPTTFEPTTFDRPTIEPTAYNPTPVNYINEVQERPGTINVLGRPGSVSLRQLAERGRGGRNNEGSGNSGRSE